MSGTEQEPDWIEKVVEVGGKLGFNKMRLRWKLIRWQERRRQAARRREQQVQHITYAHKTCPECGAVQDREEAACTGCGAKLGKRGFQVLRRLGVMGPVGLSVSALLAIAVLIAYGRTWLAMGGGFGAPSGWVLVDMGGRWPPMMADEPWRYLTAVFLHIGWWHLGFNLLAIASIGPRIEERFGRATMLGLFVVTGVLANVGALHVSALGVGAGASGGVMGLIGLAAGSGHREGTRRGKELRNDMLKWSAYTFIFGFAVNADNWAHLFGALAGAAFGLGVRPEMWKRRALLPVRALVGVVGAAGTIAALALILTRQPSARPEAETAVEDTKAAAFLEMCRRQYAGDDAGTIEAYRSYVGSAPSYEELAPAMRAGLVSQIAEGCAEFEALRQRCRNGEEARERCRAYQPMFDKLPPPRN